MSQNRSSRAFQYGLALAFALAGPVALYAQGGNGQNGSAATVPALGPLGLVGLVAGIAGAGLLVMRKNRDKNRPD